MQTNYIEHDQGSRSRAYYVDETWTLQRRSDVRSRPKGKTRTIECPVCGGPLRDRQGNLCGYCKTPLDTGDFDWRIVNVQVDQRSEHSPEVGGHAPERGNNFTTVIAGDLGVNLARLQSVEPGLWPHFETRATAVFHALQTAWSTQQWETARGVLSDALYATQMYWMQAYQRAGLRNITENSRVVRIVAARAVSDTSFDAITVRVFAQGMDYTLDATGKVVSGSRKVSRAYSEYWTFIRGVGARGKPTAAGESSSLELKCPSCGAPMKVTAAGECTYCKAPVASGEFDWVLSRIEQDEDYNG